MKAQVYILQDLKGKFYIGSTDNIERRLKQHYKNYSQTTKGMERPTLVFHQEYKSLQIAREIEQKIKKLKRKDYIEKIVRDGYIRVRVD